MADPVSTPDGKHQDVLTSGPESSFSHETSQEQNESFTSQDSRSFLSSGMDPLSPNQSNMSDSFSLTTASLENRDKHVEEQAVPPQSLGPAGDFNRVPAEKKGTDSQSVDTPMSVLSGSSKADSHNSSRPTSAASSRSPHQKEKDPGKWSKEREREERVRHTREKMAEERLRKFEELKEQQRLAQENREKQLEMRRRKIAELRRREDERRAAVEERRRRRESVEKQRREEIVNKAQERVARYEQWKLGGRKGGRGHVFGFGSRTPRDICQPFERPTRSSSHSALIRRSPNGSDSDYSRPQRRALSACSTVRRHCCVDINRTTGPCPGQHPPSKHLSVSTSVLYHKRNPEFASSGTLSNRPDSMLALNAIPEGRRSVLAPSTPPQRPQSTVGLNTVRMREYKPRQKRPASIASSMPSFMQPNDQKGASPRSKSTDRLARDKLARTPRKSLGNQNLDKKPADKEKEADKKETDKSDKKFSRHSIDRLSQPKQVKVKPQLLKADIPSPAAQKSPRSRLSPRKALSTTNLATGARKGPIRPILKDKSKEYPDTSSQASAEEAPTIVLNKPSTDGMSKSVIDISTRTVPDVMSKSVDMTEAMSKSTQDITVEEYKAKLAEKRREAREKAEREAELERQRLEEERIAEEERKKREEEEQRRHDEEVMRLAAEAQEAEKQRLEMAIEAEEARRKEEAERLQKELQAKEEAEQKAKEEAERLEKERQEKKVKEEEERQERKKRLEKIMKRVKTDGTESPKNQSPAKSVTTSPTKSTESSAENSVDDGMEETMTTTVTQTGSVTNIVTTITEETNSDSGNRSPRGSSPVPSTPGEKKEEVNTQKFRSPLLQQLVDNKPSATLTDRPKFKSPLLQNLLGKNKAGAKSGEDKVEDEKVDTSANASCDREASPSVKEQLKYDEVSDEDKDIDTSEKVSKDSTDESEDSSSVKEYAQGTDVEMNKAGVEPAPGIYFHEEEKTETSLVKETVNGLPQNGDASEFTESSVSMKSERVTNSVGENFNSQNDFEEIINLSVDTSQNNVQRSFGHETKGEHSEDLLNLTNFDSTGEDVNRTPIIAFEENVGTRQDVTDLLS